MVLRIHHHTRIAILVGAVLFSGLFSTLLAQKSKAIAQGSATKLGDSDRSASLKDWIDGPVRYIATRAEAKRFRALKDDRERALFIERFWQRRDPSPETITNEYRYLFWNRVQEANQQNFSNSREGWITDQGKIYILYGAPTNIESFYDVKTDGIPGGGDGVIRWIYEGRPGERRDLKAITVVAFVGDKNGEYRLSFDPKLNSVFFDVSQFTAPHPGIERILENLTPTQTELSVMLDLGRLQEVPPQEQVLMERIEAFENYLTFDLGFDLHRFVNEEGEWVYSITLDLSNADLVSTPTFMARFTHEDATKVPRVLGEGSFRFEPATDNRPAIAQARIVLEPGRYEVMAAAVDPTGAGTGIVRRTLNVPSRAPQTESLSHTDPFLCHELKPVDYASLASYTEPFVVGPFRCIPRIYQTLIQGDPIELLFEVNGGELPLRLTYFVERQHEGRWLPVGQPQVVDRQDRAFAWGLDTSTKWPVGDYRIRIVVRELQGEEEIEFSVPFQLLAKSEG